MRESGAELKGKTLDSTVVTKRTALRIQATERPFLGFPLEIPYVPLVEDPEEDAGNTGESVTQLAWGCCEITKEELAF